jgi:hypothetical protein
LFTYFEAKTELFNQLYLELKGEMAANGPEGPASGSAGQGAILPGLAELDQLGGNFP